jgi:hypothetical protein
MKKLLLVLAGLAVNCALAQDILSFDKDQNYILDRHGIDYCSPHTRKMVESGNVYNLEKDIQDGMFEAYNRFTAWNKGYFNSIPDTNKVISNGAIYMADKKAIPFVKGAFNESRKILGIYSLQVNDKLYGIRTIEVLEVWSNHPDLNVIEIVIMFEDFEGIWDSLIPATFDFPVECDRCPAD